MGREKVKSRGYQNGYHGSIFENIKGYRLSLIALS
ncbi:MAG: hypothetical protein US93_C0002G0025 [Candidatus Falkowbacteria bacterium GW2011_GWD2_38_42]|uniref:Uncharacterized protein n=1 Tax=Candidatus Falkowbacteria bacterium GW2011_GWE1_38_31 TaxID=1618638 RepID=A0A0G0JUD5_9BACT|nr:MAG: hypothetical protein US73_C0001G0025 [Candidatus Falkowbacteria bacterium GW2011_GWF2_38_1205]KKQ63993.1 MAG: hypothetical protein US84_C0002G0025 [Candidatus Falkowbacteria bacterium GW2011_GWF1_38_22]KKQ66659.1 MAG: hypothetical protein US87_C0001G0180 [Candidatus Falkowbacteria bacterium GW2011_GWE2_38_254]KKQ71098.1 MAG: hypothetical protein US91_C0001G0025 [Candidatus Falkowbacteria bacterium GW2011_GWE1_38_31]KKQ73224.1 MAG: hypothetical protein US93_C0002G0025 [Candidatus Falkowb